MSRHSNRFRLLLTPILLVLLWASVQAAHISFEPGDVFVSLETGPVQWWNPDGTLHSVMIPMVSGAGEGMAFDNSGNLYVARWCVDPFCMSGNTIEMFNVLGHSMGAVGHGYNCQPHTLVFDTTGVAYVGQAGCNRSVLKFVPGHIDPVEFQVAQEVQGVFWVDLGADGCTLFYTSYGPNIKRFDACAGVQLTNFNLAAFPGADVQDVHVLPDGGVLVSNREIVARLDASGALVQTYEGPNESTLFAGLDLVGDGTFWVVNYFTSDVYRFDLATGTIVDSFNTGTPPNTVVSVRVKR